MGPVGLARWRPHLRAAKVAGVSLARYARERGLSRDMLYAAQRAERERRAVDDAGDQVSPGSSKRASRSLPVVVSPFVPVAVRRSAARLAVRLPNGVALDCQDFDAEVLRALIASLWALPCSV
jgi:hypothetical protein